jgi:hypothetical protein
MVKMIPINVFNNALTLQTNLNFRHSEYVSLPVQMAILEITLRDFAFRNVTIIRLRMTQQNIVCITARRNIRF